MMKLLVWLIFASIALSLAAPPKPKDTATRKETGIKEPTTNATKKADPKADDYEDYDYESGGAPATVKGGSTTAATKKKSPKPSKKKGHHPMNRPPAGSMVPPNHENPSTYPPTRGDGDSSNWYPYYPQYDYQYQYQYPSYYGSDYYYPYRRYYPQYSQQSYYPQESYNYPSYNWDTSGYSGYYNDYYNQPRSYYDTSYDSYQPYYYQQAY